MPNSKPPELEYPRAWCYRIIFEHGNLNCERLLGEYLLSNGISPGQLTPGGTSKNGKYLVNQLKVQVRSRAEMEKIGVELARIDGVKFIL